MNHRDIIISKKIISYCERIEKEHEIFHDDKELFFDEERGFVYRDAVAMSVLQIGELAKSFSEEIAVVCPSVTWKAIKGMRDIFAHHYGKLDKDILWEASHREFREMKEALEEVIRDD